jgi:hypothetical protein
MGKEDFLRRVAFLLPLSALATLACSNEKSGASSETGGKATCGAGGSTSAGSGGGGSGGKAGSGGASGGGAGAPFTRGEIIEFLPGTGDVPYVLGENPYGIHGGGFLARAANGNTITVGDDDGKICIQGELEPVPNNDYSGYWGVEIGFNLNQNAPDDGAGGEGGADGAGGAGGEGGAPPDVAEPWHPGNVVGFSFVIEGPTIDAIRFKSLPAGYDAALESSVFCNPVSAATGEPNDVPLTQMVQYCWSGSQNLKLPTAAGLSNIAWQLPAEVGVTRPFDWCLKDLRPLLSAP